MPYNFRKLLICSLRETVNSIVSVIIPFLLFKYTFYYIKVPEITGNLLIAPPLIRAAQLLRKEKNLLQIYATNKFPSFLCCITGALENPCLLRDRK